MYLAEDRVSTCRWRVIFFSILTHFAPFSDLVLGTGIEAGRVVGPPLCQVGLRHHGYSG